MRHARTSFLPLVLLLAAPAFAQQATEVTEFGDDRFVWGSSVAFDEVGVDDLFIAGGAVRAASDISGSAHIAGRQVEMVGAVGGDAYMAGMNLVLTGNVAGDATLAGSDVRVGEVGGDLRIVGNTLVVRGPIAGSALITGYDVRIEGPILGDVQVESGSLSFSDGARIDGQLILLEQEPGEKFVPPTVVPEDRIERRRFEQGGAAAEAERTSTQDVLVQLLTQIVTFTALAALAAGIAPKKVPELGRAVFGQPRRVLLRGFLFESAIGGSGIVLAVIVISLFSSTLLGILLIPLSLLAAWCVGVAGYVVGIYALGVGLLMSFGRRAPEGFGPRVLAAGVGALAARSLALLPIVGWLALLGLTLAGVGAFTLRWTLPKPMPASGA